MNLSLLLLLQIIPADRLTAWNPGMMLQGGIPVRNTVCATVNASTYGNGTQEASGGIQAAIDSCPPGQVVLLSAGQFLLNNHILIWKGITLRGAGPTLTTIKKTNGAVAGTYFVDEYDAPIVVATTYYGIGGDTTVNLTSDAVKGATSVTVTNASGFAVSQIVKLDEDNYSTGAWKDLPNWNGSPSNVDVWATDRISWQRHNPGQSGDDPFPDALTWFSVSGRPVCELKEIASINGNTITFTSPIHIAYRTARSAQLRDFTGVVKNAGVESLKVTGGSDGNIRFIEAAYSWAKDIDNTVYLGHGFAVNNSFRIEIRHSYIHDGAWQSPGGGGYAIAQNYGSSEVLIEDNIIKDHNKIMVCNASGAGSVAGYNYTDNSNINYDTGWQEVGLNCSHFVGSHHMLFEGNYGTNYDSDNTHGTAIYHTVLRNHLSGFRRDYSGLGNGRTGGLSYGAYWHNFVGNVQGVPGQMTGWLYQDFQPWPSNIAVWRLGYDPLRWQEEPDPEVLSGSKAALREGNWDYVTNSVHWTVTPEAIPNSYYLASKPSFFGSYTWPWVDPVGATKVYVLPAKARYDAGTPFAGPPGETLPVPVAPGQPTLTYTLIGS